MNNEDMKNRQMEFEVFAKNKKSDYAYLADIREHATAGNAPINVAFSHQSVIILVICVLMSLVVSFTLGVEKGKLIAKNTFEAQKSVLALAPADRATTANPAAAQQKLALSQETAVLEAKVALSAVAPDKTEETALAAKNKEGAPQNAYAIQIASVKSVSAAKQLTESLVKKGMPSFTRTSGKYTIVLAGNFPKKEDAKISLKELQKTFADCFIKKI